jgi:hypothetical protein
MVRSVNRPTGERERWPRQPASKGIVDIPSNQTVQQSAERLKSILQAKGVTLFAVVDHGGEAEKIGMKMRPTKLLIFGNPEAGTPLMQAAPSSAIERHGLRPELLQNIAVVETLASKAGE